QLSGFNALQDAIGRDPVAVAQAAPAASLVIRVSSNHLRREAVEQVKDAGGLAAVDGAGQAHHLLRRLSQVVHGVTLVAVDALVLVDFVHEQQVQPSARLALDVPGQRHFSVAEGIADHGTGPTFALMGRYLTVALEIATQQTLPFGVALEATALLVLATTARELEERATAPGVIAEAPGCFQ